jgi:hypothetical protein
MTSTNRGIFSAEAEVDRILALLLPVRRNSAALTFVWTWQKNCHLIENSLFVVLMLGICCFILVSGVERSSINWTFVLFVSDLLAVPAERFFLFLTYMSNTFTT